ncbi:MAG TPA: hypothetical protein PKY82_01770 [Pyrinomonadaceae bacterium]|nr:hypothetical protein [Pyrinomonadaceae bacterium]
MFFLILLLQKDVVGQRYYQVLSFSKNLTWITVILVLSWVVWYLIERYWRKNAKRRQPGQSKDSNLRKIVRLKDELSAVWLRRGASKRVHAIGIGKLENGNFCLQIFINDSNEQMFENPPSNSIPDVYKGMPIVLIAMPEASFLSNFSNFSAEEYRQLIREKQDVIMGGISGANTNLDGECGTIGYFCRKKSLIPRKETYLLSNSHVFADLRKSVVDEHDLIMQPSPGESSNSRPIGELTTFAHPKIENDTNDANFVDAAIAKLWKQEVHKPLIPLIGKINGFVEKSDVEVGESSRKFGRTTGFTKGKVFSIYLDIWVKYDRTGQSSYFKNQFLIEPDRTNSEKFVEKGDSGSLVVDGENFATGLIFAGANGQIELREKPNKSAAKIFITVKNYGVANPISEVLKRLNIELL